MQVSALAGAGFLMIVFVAEGGVGGALRISPRRRNRATSRCDRGCAAHSIQRGLMHTVGDAALYRDREDAGRRLSARLAPLAQDRPVVMGLPRGGVPVAFEVASALGAPLDVVVVRKLGAPMQPELAIGAIGEEGVIVLNQDLVRALTIQRQELEAVVAREQAELTRRQRLYRGDRPPVAVAGRTVVLVDDGIATGSTAMAAAQVLHERDARRVVLAVPVGPPDAAARFGPEVDELVCLQAPEWFFAVGSCYERFDQVSDEQVRELLERARAGVPPAAAGD